jgi:hypothetical protein
MRPTLRRSVVAALGGTLLAAPATAHGLRAASTGVAFPLVVAGVVGLSLGGGALVLVASARADCPSAAVHRVAVPLLVLALGGAALALALTRSLGTALAGALVGASVVYLARGAAVTDCGVCADAALGAVTLHRGFEGAVLATVYAADAALGLVGALVIAVHATAETAAVGSLYAPAGRRYAVAAVVAVQAGFVVGVAAGWEIVGGVPPTAEAGLLALVGGVLLAVGGREARRRHVTATPGVA